MKLRADTLAALTRRIRIRVTRKYWIITVSPLDPDETHVYPNRDTIRHEALDCPCGPNTELIPGDGNVWLITHHSLDAREGTR